MLTSLSDISHCRGGIILSGWNTAHLVWASECLRSLCLVFIAKLDGISQNSSELPRIRWSAVFKGEGWAALTERWQSVLIFCLAVCQNSAHIGASTQCYFTETEIRSKHLMSTVWFRWFAFMKVWVLTTLAWKPCFNLSNQRCIFTYNKAFQQAFIQTFPCCSQKYQPS